MKVLFFVFALLAIYSCNSQKESLVAKVKGWDNDTIFLVTYRWGDSIEKTDTLIAKNGKVVYSNLNINDTIEVILCSQKNAESRAHRFLISTAPAIRTIIIGNSKETITGKLYGDKLIYSSKGTLPFLKEQAELHSIQVDIKARKDANEDKINQYPSNSKLFDIRKLHNDTLRQIEKDFIRNRPNSHFSGKLTAMSRFEDFYSNYNLLNDEVKKGIFSSRLIRTKQRVDDYNQVQKNKEFIKSGKTAPPFKLPSLDGNEVTLENFREKWIILDFWGSWCVPCLKGIPDLKKAYHTNKSKLEVIGIACNDTKQNWRNTIKKYELNWINLFSNKQVTIDYAIEAYPTKILIDPQGIIRLRVVGDDPIFYSQLEDIMKE